MLRLNVFYSPTGPTKVGMYLRPLHDPRISVLSTYACMYVCVVLIRQ